MNNNRESFFNGRAVVAVGFVALSVFCLRGAEFTPGGAGAEITRDGARESGHGGESICYPDSRAQPRVAPAARCPDSRAQPRVNALPRVNPEWGSPELLKYSHVHRGGGKKEAPDNTLETFIWCWEHGSALECDCRKTKDGVGILLHDDNLIRTGWDVPVQIARKSVSRELTWNDIKDFEVGRYQGEQFAGQRIPTIEATFAAMKGRPERLCFVDEKGAGPEYIAKKALEAGVEAQVFYTGPSHEKIFEWRKILPEGKAMIWLGAWPKNHGAAERERADKWFREAMAKLKAKDFKYIDCVSIHTYYDPADPVDPFVPSSALLR